MRGEIRPQVGDASRIGTTFCYNLGGLTGGLAGGLAFSLTFSFAFNYAFSCAFSREP